MKFLHVANIADLYGAGRSLLRLTAQLVREGHQVTVVLPEEGPLRAKLAAAGAATVIHLDLAVMRRRDLKTLGGRLRFCRRAVGSTLRLVSLIRKERPDVVHTNSAVVFSPAVAARLCGAPHVWHIREFLADVHPCWRLYQWFLHCFADVIVCISEAVAGQFHPLIRSERVRVVYNCVPEEDAAAPSAERVEDARRRYGLTGRPLAAVVGRINLEQKGQDVFVRAAAEVARRFPRAGFLIAGGAFPGNEDQLRRLHQLVEDLGLEERVRWIGEVADMAAFYAAVDVCVLPARKPEGLGNVLVEAMALGKPVVGAATGGIPEIIEDGVNGCLFPVGDAGSLAAAIGKLFADAGLRRRMGKRGRRRCRAVFGPERWRSQMRLVWKAALRRC